jgi:Leucine-rich repeat (LRR) protein
MQLNLSLLKSKWPILLSVFLLNLFRISSIACAQNIPDTNFANAIRSTCPTCIDATNNLLPPAASLTALDVSNKNISDLTGIGGFTSLLQLNCANNQLTKLPPLPKLLIGLFCEINQITELPPLPNGLIVIYCQSNKISYLPTIPSSLQRLMCGANQLKELPSLPDNLSHLFCYSNQLTSLPTLKNVAYLDCKDNSLGALPPLPNKLFVLYCSNNQLKMLPPIPISLRELYCNNNQLTSLPELQPSAIAMTQFYFLHCYNNPLTCLPLLPNSLLSLYIDTDKIKCLPNHINGLQIRDANNNPIPTPPLCPSTLNHTAGTLATGTYVATQAISSTASLSLGTTNYHASEAITLNPGFQTALGRTFSVEIRGCK